jgi:glycosyltransferase involved in cell wall biosynthesis
MTRVAIFTDNDFAKVNGVTTTLKAVLRGSDASVRPRVYTAADVAADTGEYLAVRSIGVGLPWYREMRVYWPRLARLAAHLRADGTDVVHVTTPGPVGLAGRWLARRLELPLTGSYHTHLGAYAEVLSGSRRLGRWMELYMRWLYGPCDPLLVPSRATQAMLASFRYPVSRLGIWARGVDTERFTPTRRSPALREAWQVDDDRPAVVYAGRVSREKGLDLIAPIQRRLRQLGLPHRFVFVGDGPFAAELRRTCPDAVFLGSVSHDEVATAMASADVFLFPSATDSLGNVVLEAQACGLPVLVTDRGGPQEQIRPGQSGFVCAAHDPEALTLPLGRLIRHLEMRRRMSAEARAVALTRAWPVALQPLFKAWRDAASRHAARRPARPVRPSRVRKLAAAEGRS